MTKAAVKDIEGAYDRYLAGIKAVRERGANIEKTADEGGAKLQGRQNNITLSPDEDIVQNNTSNGNSAVKSLIEQAKTSDNPEDLVFENAMYRSDIGQIDFRWGTSGKGEKFKHGDGFAHIIAKRNAENNDGEAVAYKMVEVIAKATDGSRQSNNQVSQDDARIKLYYDGYTAVLVKSNDARKWLLTGWENEETATNATGEVRDSSSATAVTPIRTRRNGDVTVSNNIIIQQSYDNINTSTQKNQSRSDADYLSAVKRGDMNTAQRMVDEAAERAFAKEGRTGYDEIIKSAVEDNRVIDYDKSKRADLSEVAQTTSLGSITESSLEHNLSQFKKEINTFKQKNRISYQSRSDADYLSAVKRGDMDTAQRMVDEAAERAFAKSKIRLPDKNKTAIVSMMFEKIP